MATISPDAALKQTLILISPQALGSGDWRSDPAPASHLARLGELAGIVAAASALAYPHQAQAAWHLASAAPSP